MYFLLLKRITLQNANSLFKILTMPHKGTGKKKDYEKLQKLTLLFFVTRLTSFVTLLLTVLKKLFFMEIIHHSNVDSIN